MRATLYKCLSCYFFHKAFFDSVLSLQVDLSALDEDIDWWSKYYASMGEFNKCRKYREMGYDTLMVSDLIGHLLAIYLFYLFIISESENNLFYFTVLCMTAV